MGSWVDGRFRKEYISYIPASQVSIRVTLLVRSTVSTAEMMTAGSSCQDVLGLAAALRPAQLPALPTSKQNTYHTVASSHASTPAASLCASGYKPVLGNEQSAASTPTGLRGAYTENVKSGVYFASPPCVTRYL